MSEHQEGQPEIQVVAPMRQAWEDGVSGYEPRFRDRPMEPECGAVETSLKNLREIVQTGAEVCSMYAGKSGVLVNFYGGLSYLATGFAVGKSAGIKVKGFSQFAAEVGLGDAEKVQWYFGAYPDDYEGELEFPVPGDMSVVK